MQIGNVIRVYDRDAPHEYLDCILAQVEPNLVCAVCLDTGNRWSDPSFVRDTHMDRILGKGACYTLLKEVKNPQWLVDLRAKLNTDSPF
jgi:hypothetical protein